MTSLLGSHSAAAQSGVDWHAPEECPSPGAARAEIAALSQRKAATPEAVVVIERVSSAMFQARVAVGAANGQREHVLRDASCSVLTRAAALIVALAAGRLATLAPTHGRKPDRSAPAPTSSGAAAQRANANTLAGLQPIAAGTAAESPPSASVQAPAADAHAAVDSQPPAPRAAVDLQPSDAAGRDHDDAAPVPAVQKIAARDVLPARGVSAGSGGRSALALRAPSVADAASPQPSGLQLTPARSEHDRRDREHDLMPPGGDRQARLFGVFVGLAGGVSSGPLPKLAPTGALGAGLMFRDLRVGLRIGFAPSQHAELLSPAGAGGRVALALVAIEGGTSLFRGAVIEVPLLVGVETGALIGRGQGVPEKDTRVLPWLAPFLSSGVSHTWAKRWRVALQLQGLLALRRPRFALDIEGVGPVVFHRPSFFAARFFCALEWVIQ